MKKGDMLLLLAALGAAGAGVYYWMKKPTVYTCPYCGVTFGTEDDLASHVLTQHPSAATYTCQYCGQIFTTSGDLAAHITSAHPAAVYTCPTCGAQFTTAAALVEHTASAHPAPTFTCPTCGLQFNTAAELILHITSAHPTQVYVCSICGAQFATQSELGTHVATAHPPQQYICPICSATFETSAELGAHITTVHPSIPPTPPPTLTKIDEVRQWTVSRLGKIYEITLEETACLGADAGWFSVTSGGSSADTRFTVNSVLLFGDLEEHATFEFTKYYPQYVGNLIGGQFPTEHGGSPQLYTTYKILGDWTVGDKLIFSPAVYLLTWTGSETLLYPNVYRMPPNTTRAGWYLRIKPLRWVTGEFSFLTAEVRAILPSGWVLFTGLALTIKNTGDNPAYGVKATIVLPEGTQLAGLYGKPYGGGVLTIEVGDISAHGTSPSRNIIWYIGTVPIYSIKIEASVMIPI